MPVDMLKVLVIDQVVPFILVRTQNHHKSRKASMENIDLISANDPPILPIQVSTTVECAEIF